MKSNNIINLLFIGFGLYAIVNPKNITLEEIKRSYNTNDLIKGWGIYSVTIGSLLRYPKKKQLILQLCFLTYILWHFLIVNNSGWTLHHKHRIIINLKLF